VGLPMRYLRNSVVIVLGLDIPGDQFVPGIQDWLSRLAARRQSETAPSFTFTREKSAEGVQIGLVAHRLWCPPPTDHGLDFCSNQVWRRDHQDALDPLRRWQCRDAPNID